MKTIRRLLFVILTAVSVFSVQAVETAEQVLQKCADKMKNAPSLSMQFDLNYGDNKSACDITISREKYTLSSPELKIWYDGKSQWSYSSADKEVTITEPTEGELLESNPFALLTNYKRLFTFRRLSGNKNDIELVAKNKMSTIRKAVVTIDSKTSLPSKLIVMMSNGRTFSATVKSAVTGKALPNTTFTFNKSKYPTTTTIDLR